jgi:CBS domain-containing protein
MRDIQLVRDLMTVGVRTCSPDTPITDIARLMLIESLEAVVVLAPEGHAVGIVSQDELARAYTHDDRHTLTAASIMREDVPQVPPDIPITAAAQIMQDRRTRVLFLTHHAEGITYPAAVLSYSHLLRHLAARDDAELTGLGIRATREAPLDTFIKRRDAARRRASTDQD